MDLRVDGDDDDDDDASAAAAAVAEDEEGGTLLVEEGMEGSVGYMTSASEVDSVVVEGEVIVLLRGFWRRYSVSHSVAAMMAGCDDCNVGCLGCGRGWASSDF